MPDADLTELVEIDTSRVDGVKNPASGFPILVMKAVNAQGGIDEKPDIAGAQSVIQQLARLISAEADEMAVGQWDEAYDIQLLCEAVSLMRCFMRNEQWGDEDDGEPVTKELAHAVIKDFLAKRKVTADERKSLAGEGKALPDGSYPIDNAEDLHNAAILARSGHGDVAAARRLIAKRAKELGVTNPLASDNASKETGVPDVKDEKTSAAPESQDKPVEKSAAELMDEAVAKAVEPLQEVIKGLEAEMAALKSTPIPGGPVVTSTKTVSTNERAQAHAAAARFERLAKSVSDRDLVRYYEEKAAEARKAANG